MFAASYEATGAWLDLARQDSLYLLLLLVAIERIRADASPRRALESGRARDLDSLELDAQLRSVYALASELERERATPALRAAFAALGARRSRPDGGVTLAPDDLARFLAAWGDLRRALSIDWSAGVPAGPNTPRLR